MEHENEKKWVILSWKAATAVMMALALTLIAFPKHDENISVFASQDIDAVQTLAKEEPQVRPISEKLIPLGKTTGIKIFSEGAMVVGFADLENCPEKCPAKAGGLQTGDVIIACNGIEVDSNESLVDALSSLQSQEVKLRVLREDKQIEVKVNAFFDKELGAYRMGAWVRDSMAGIGTITYVDPENGAFGALGHGICDVDTGSLMPFESGSLMRSSVQGVKKGLAGSPGELSGSFDLSKDQGVLYENTSGGIFGRLTDDSLYSTEKAFPTAMKSELKEGKAYIITNVDGEKSELFEIKIVRVYPENDESMRDMMIEVTDTALLNKTGGIVQGMSGSPILQNGKLVGAVTHVLVNDPHRGYAISIERMLEKAAA